MIALATSLAVLLSSALGRLRRHRAAAATRPARCRGNACAHRGRAAEGYDADRRVGAPRSTERKATVILVSDGGETCGADPCALGAELEAGRVDFTTHVIGFDLDARSRAREQLACLARAAGGLHRRGRCSPTGHRLAPGHRCGHRAGDDRMRSLRRRRAVCRGLADLADRRHCARHRRRRSAAVRRRRTGGRRKPAAVSGAARGGRGLCGLVVGAGRQKLSHPAGLLPTGCCRRPGDAAARPRGHGGHQGRPCGDRGGGRCGVHAGAVTQCGNVAVARP
jgi:hypothetical protein